MHSLKKLIKLLVIENIKHSLIENASTIPTIGGMLTLLYNDKLDDFSVYLDYYKETDPDTAEILEKIQENNSVYNINIKFPLKSNSFAVIANNMYSYMKPDIIVVDDADEISSVYENYCNSLSDDEIADFEKNYNDTIVNVYRDYIQENDLDVEYDNEWDLEEIRSQLSEEDLANIDDEVDTMSSNNYYHSDNGVMLPYENITVFNEISLEELYNKWMQ